MTQSENDTLVALEHLMDEFFNHATTNIRKCEIESHLNSFSSQKDAWKYCIYFITHTSSQYVSMYALSTIESVINQQWNSLDWKHRVHLKSTLYSYLVEQDATAPHFLRNKLAKLLVDIARFDWPHFYPDFFSNILQLLRSDQGQLLGLVLLRTTSEELMSPRPDLSSYRKEELSRSLDQHIPQVFHILTTILENLGTKPRHAVTATPPPSPTHPSSAPDLTRELSAAAFRPDSKAITREALATTQHIFTWAQLTQVPTQLIEAIFHFTHVSSYAQDDDDMCVLAISTLNELLYRKCAPPGSQNLFIRLYHNTVQLLRDITCPSSSRIETLGADFIDKLSELLCLLVEQHLWRLEAEPRFSALDFLSLLFELTMQLPAARCYLRLLSVWATFIKQLKPQNANKYSEALLGLATAVLNKMQFSYNKNQLEETDNKVLNDDNETEWHVFLRQSVELIAMISEYNPLETFNQVFVLWKSTNDTYCLLKNAVDQQNYILKVEPSENERLHCILRDLSSLTQTLARLSTFFMDQDNDYSKAATPLVENLITKLLESASLATTTRFHLLKVSDSKLVEDFASVHSQFIAALKTWSQWLSLSGEVGSHHLKQLVEISVPILRSGSQDPSIVTLASAQLLLCLSNVVFPPHLLTLPPVVELVQSSPNLKFSNGEIRKVLYNSVCNILIRPWGELSQVHVMQRNLLITEFFNALTKDFRELVPNSADARVKEVVSGALPLISNMVEFCKNHPSNSKKLLYMGIKATLDHALELFPSYTRYPDASDHILVLFLNVLCVLQQQLGVENIKHAVQVFLEVAIREQQAKNLSGLDKLLQILQLVVEAPGSSYKSFLPGILQLCLEQVYPLVIAQANEQPDSIIALLTLLHSVLFHRWNYFYISQVRLGHSPGCSEVEMAPDSIQEPAQLLAILETFGRALLQPDINTFRTSLGALEDLNYKWKLYHKVLFREQLLSQFLTVLLHTLLDKSHALLTDDILMGIYNMATVNFEGFFKTFLSQFLQATDGLAQPQRESLLQGFAHDTDMPTFIQHVQRLVNDIRCYRLCNTSLPAGSVLL